MTLKILCLSGLDIGGQGQRLSRWFNEHTPYKFTNAVYQPTYLGYKADIDLSQVKSFDASEYDFYIMRWHTPDQIAEHVRQGTLHKKNCIIKHHGSEVRYNQYAWLGLWLHSGITMVTNGYDWSMQNNLGFTVQHIPHMLDLSTVSKLGLEQPEYDEFTIAHAPTDRKKKGTDYLFNAVKAVNEKAGQHVASIKLIENMPWEQAVAAKGRCQACFDQISDDSGIGTFGASMLEALAQKQYVFGHYNKFTYCAFPELEDFVIDVTPQNFAEKIEEQVKHFQRHGEPDARVEEAYKWVMRTWNPDMVGRRWRNLIEHVISQ